MPYKSYKNITHDRDERLLEILSRIFWPALSYERRRVIHAFRRCLTPKWFEKYVERYYALRKWYGVNIKRRADDSKAITDDHWVDIEGTKQDEEWNRKGVFIQCKRYSWVKTGKFTGIVGRNDIAIFLWNSQSPENRRSWPIELVFATTSYLEKKAAAEAEAQEITVIDCVELARIDLEEYPLSEFIKDLLTKGKEEYRELFLDWEYVLAYYDVKKYICESSELMYETRQKLEDLKVELKKFPILDSGIENSLFSNRFKRTPPRWSCPQFSGNGWKRNTQRLETEDNESSRISFWWLVTIWIVAIIVFWIFFLLGNGESKNKIPSYIKPVITGDVPEISQDNDTVMSNAKEGRKEEKYTIEKNIKRQP